MNKSSANGLDSGKTRKVKAVRSWLGTLRYNSGGGFSEGKYIIKLPKRVRTVSGGRESHFGEVDGGGGGPGIVLVGRSGVRSLNISLG